MRKLEEKFKNIVPKEFGGLDPELIEKCIFITEQECIGFAEWLPQNANPLAPNLGEWQIFGDKKVYKTDGIFQLYQKSKEPITITAHGVTKYADEDQKSKENE